MKKITIICSLFTITCSLFMTCALFAAPLKWVCNWPEASSQTFALYQGETAEFEPVFKVNGKAVTNVSIFAVWYQTNGMDQAWWKLDGNVFAPSNDVGAASYRFFVEAHQQPTQNSQLTTPNSQLSTPNSQLSTPNSQLSTSKIYRANGTLRMLPSPGFVPNAIEPPIVTLDFAALNVLNAPWVDSIVSATNAVLSAANNYAVGTTMIMHGDLSRDLISATNAVLSAANSYAVGTAMITYGDLSRDIISATNAVLAAANNYAANVSMWSHGELLSNIASASNAVSQSLSSQLSQTAQAATNYTDAAIAAIPAPDLSGKADKTKAENIEAADYWTDNNGVIFPRCESSEAGWMVWGPNGESGTPIIDYTILGREYTYFNGGTPLQSQNASYTGEETEIHFPGGVTIVRTYREAATVLHPVIYGDALANATNAVSQSLSSRLSLSSQSSTNYTDSVAADLYPKSQGETLATQFAAIGAVLNGEDARFVVTNYDSVVHTPEAYVEVQVSNNWLRVWREGYRWDKFETENHVFKTNVTAELAHKADRAWGAYDSETGGYAPDGHVQISTSNILIAAGMAYQRTVTSGGAVWVLQCNSGVASIGVDTNGFFRVQDGDGETQFEIVQGDKRTIGADADGISVDNSTTPATVTIHYSVIADAHPTLEITSDLAAPDWKDEQAADCLANVSWSGTSGSYVATVQPWGALPSLFVKASYMAGGETYIRNVAPVSFQGGVLCTDGIHKVRFVYSNGTVNLEVVQ